MTHDPSTHRADCFVCGRRARWHVDCWVFGCANLCGIHARAVQRRSLWTAIFSPPVIVEEEGEEHAGKPYSARR